MEILGYLLLFLGNLLDILLTIYSFIVIAAALVSWLNPSPYNPIIKFLYRVTEPALSKIRRFISFRLPVDISPIVLLLIIYVVQKFIIQAIIEFGYRIKGGTL